MQSIHIVYILLYIYWFGLCVNCEWIENKGLWYYISPSEELVDYDAAIASCASMNSRLAVITNNDQNNVIGDYIDDDTQRWIGLSNIESQDYIHKFCKNEDYFWNYDFYCKNGYDNYQNSYEPPETDNCMGVIRNRDGSWTADNCENTFGFICQWECKRLYIQFETLNLYSGLYMLYFYWNGHIVYVKTDTNFSIEIYKENGYWLLGEYSGENYIEIATFTSESNVPYGESTSWVKHVREDDEHIGFASLCVDCDRLSLFVDTYNNERIDYDDIVLASNTVPYPTHADIKHSAIIYYNAALFTYCIEIQIPGRANRVHYCDYIFPYPDETLIIKTDDEDTVFINNVCIAGHESVSTNSVFSTSQSIDVPAKLSESTTGSQLRIHEYTSTTIIIPTNSSGLLAQLGDKVDSKTVAIAVTVSVLITVVIVIVSVFCVRRKRHKKERHNTFRNKNTPIRAAQANPNIYLELDGSPAATTLNDNQGLESNVGEYSYANILSLGPKPVVDSTTQTKQAPSNRPAPVEEYLAPDYGVLNAQRVFQTDKVDTNVISDAVLAVYCEAKAPKGSPTHKEADHNKSADSQNAKKNAKFDSDEDLQLHENEVYAETVDNNQ